MVSLEAGLWRIGAKVDSVACEDILHLRLLPTALDGDTGNGQWVAECLPNSASGVLRNLLVAVACRAGLLPVLFDPHFERELLSGKSLCIVADTNSLYYGALFQALRLRQGKPTLAYVPDQVFMEVHRRRESKAAADKGKKGTTPNEPGIDGSLLRVVRGQHPDLAARSLLRIRGELGFLVHQARPPEPMVRFFGSDSGAPTDDETWVAHSAEVGSNAQRDRLILEVVRHVRGQVPPEVSTWLLTSDGNLAEQAEFEGFFAGFCRLPAAPTPFVIGSPFFEPRDLSTRHVPCSAMMEELLWSLRFLTAQREGEVTHRQFQLPRDRAHLILERRGVPWPAGWRGESSCAPWTSTDLRDAPNLTAAPRKAPAGSSLIQFLVKLCDGPLELSKMFEPVRPYLPALSWGDVAGGIVTLTARGRALAEHWKTLKRDSVLEHRDWLVEAASEIRRLRPCVELLDVMRPEKGVSSEFIAKKLGWTVSVVEAQARFLSAFGLLVRLNGLHWSVTEFVSADAVDVVYKALQRLVPDASASGGAVPAEALFRRLLDSTPMALHHFRAAVFLLHQDGRIVLGGSAPDAEGLEIRAVVPDAENIAVDEKINLSAGDYLIPGKSTQTIRLQEAPR